MRWGAVPIAALLILLTGCGGEDPPTAPSTSSPPAKAVAYDPPKAFAVDRASDIGSTSLLGDDPASGRTRERMTVVKDVLVAHTVRGVVGIDVASGRELWRREFDSGFDTAQTKAMDSALGAPMATTDQDGVLLARPIDGDLASPKRRVLRIAVQSGEIAWQTDLDVPPQEVFTSVVGVDSTRVVVTTFAQRSQITTLDVNSGAVLWRQERLFAMRMTADTIFAVPEYTFGVPTTRVVGLSAADGTQRWELVGNYDEYLALAATQSNFVLKRRVPAEYRYEILWVDAAGGKALSPIPATKTTNCTFDGRKTVLCGDVDGRNTGGYDARDGSLLWAPPTPASPATATGPALQSALNGVMYLNDNGKAIAADAATGKPLPDRPEAAPFKVSPYGGVFVQGSSLRVAPSAA